MTKEKDIVLIHFEEQPLAFARIEDISPDHKKDWYHVRLLLLKIPVQVVTWILRSAYIDGEPFTMSGNRMRLEKVVCPEPEHEHEHDSVSEDARSEKEIVKGDGAEVISFMDRKK